MSSDQDKARLRYLRACVQELEEEFAMLRERNRTLAAGLLHVSEQLAEERNEASAGAKLRDQIELEVQTEPDQF